MKKLFTIMFFLSLVTISLVQAQIKTPIGKTYTGAEYIDGTIVNGKATMVDKNFKQGILFERARAWVKTNYTFGGDVIEYVEGKTIIILSEFPNDIDYKLVLEFKNGSFSYTYSDNTNCSQAVITKYVKPSLEDLAKYLKRGKNDQLK